MTIGEDFSRKITLTGINLTSCTIKAQIRKTPSSNTAYDFTPRITSAVGGEFYLEMAKAVNALIVNELPEESAQEKTEFLFSWDLFVTDSLNKTTPYFEGVVTIKRGTTEIV